MGKFDVVQHNSEIKSTENNEFSDFENTKMALYNAGEIKDIKNNPVVKTTILSVLKSIPIHRRRKHFRVCNFRYAVCCRKRFDEG